MFFMLQILQNRTGPGTSSRVFRSDRPVRSGFQNIALPREDMIQIRVNKGSSCTPTMARVICEADPIGNLNINSSTHSSFPYERFTNRVSRPSSLKFSSQFFHRLPPKLWKIRTKILKSVVMISATFVISRRLILRAIASIGIMYVFASICLIATYFSEFCT